MKDHQGQQCQADRGSGRKYNLDKYRSVYQGFFGPTELCSNLIRPVKMQAAGRPANQAVHYKK